MRFVLRACLVLALGGVSESGLLSSGAATPR